MEDLLFGKMKRRGNIKCNSKFTLGNLRKLAEQSGVNVYSNAKLGYSKTTGVQKKPKRLVVLR